MAHFVEFSRENGQWTERDIPGYGIPDDVKMAIKEEIRRNAEIGIYSGTMGEYTWEPV